MNEESQSRSVLFDITNDSPIIGVAMKSNFLEKTPSFSISKHQVSLKNTPGSGEALLRSQVRCLLQKVEEEEAELVISTFLSGADPVKPLAPVQVALEINPIQQECVINRALLFDSPDKYSEETDESIDDLCEELTNMKVNKGLGLLTNIGKHTKFVYNSDDEIEGEELVEDEDDCDAIVSTNVMALKGFPLPQGKHLRFNDEDDENSD